MENKYLEKVAGFVARLQGTNTGKAMGNLASSTNAEVLAGLGSSSKMHAMNTGDKTSKWGLTGKKMVNAGKTRMTGDSLAASSIQDRLAAKKKLASGVADMAKAHKANVAAGALKKSAPNAVQGVLGKALSMARKNPIAATAVGVGAGIMAGKAFGGKKQDQSSQGYY